MEDTLVSAHRLDMSSYRGKGKWRGVVIAWVLAFGFFLATRFSSVQQAVTDFAISVCGVQGGTVNADFLINKFWLVLVVLSISTAILWRKRQLFSEIRIYRDAMGFVMLDGTERRVGHEQVYVHYGRYQKTFWIECAALGIPDYYYPWEDFSDPEVLQQHLLQYANWELSKYKK